VTQATGLAFGDEMRVGLMGQVRKVWAPRGVKVRQRVQLERKWRYLALAVDGRRGRLSWCWIASMKEPAIAEAVRHWRADGVEAVVWDGAKGHRGEAVRQVGVALVQQPPYAPEVQPAERVFEELRRAIEGKVYPSLEAKVAAVEAEVAQWAADPERVKQLTGWAWIAAARAGLPAGEAPPQHRVEAHPLELVA
jgi:DDE superfamily endonuclease